jgi:DNA-directed RNA polymerase subunit E'/Rpb7
MENCLILEIDLQAEKNQKWIYYIEERKRNLQEVEEVKKKIFHLNYVESLMKNYHLILLGKEKNTEGRRKLEKNDLKRYYQ